MKKHFICHTGIVIFLSLLATSCVSEAGGVIWDFESGMRNARGGYYNPFKKSPSDCRLFFQHEMRDGIDTRVLAARFDKQDEGFCGFWMHLYNSDEPGDTADLFDASAYKYLSFSVRGAKGGETFRVQLADRAWLAKEDSVSIGSIEDFLPNGVSSSWQEVNIPLERASDVDIKNLAVFAINFVKPDEGSIFIDNLMFKKNIEEKIAVSVPKEKTGEFQKRKRAMWVWHTKDYLDDDARRDELFAFALAKNVGTLFIQLQVEYTQDEEGVYRCKLLHVDKVREFNRIAHEKGLVIEALDGHPEFVVKEYHQKLLSQVSALIDFNRAVAPEERFDGIHYDNEPYLLPLYHLKPKEVLRDFLAMNVACVELLRSRESDMHYGIDIPFWFKDYPGYANSVVDTMVMEFQGKTQSLNKHLIDICDNIGIMDYRNTAGGADGIIRHGIEEIKYASEVQKEVFIGVETFRYDNDIAYFAVFMDMDDYRRAIGSGGKAKELIHKRRVDGFDIRTVKTEDQLYMGLVFPEKKLSDSGAEERFKEALKTLHAGFAGFASRSIDDYLFDASFAVGSDDEINRFETIDYAFAPGETIKVIKAYTHMNPKITFAGFSEEDFENELAQAEEAFGSYPSFKGFAIHYYRTYKELSTKQTP